MLQPRAPTEDEKGAGLQRLSNRYGPSVSPVVVQGKEDYKRLKLTEAFQDIDTNRDNMISYDELVRHLSTKAKEVRRDPNFDFSRIELDNIRQLYDAIDTDRSGSIST